MAQRKSIPINFGRRDKTASKFAPHGVLKSAKNARHRELGGIGIRNGYAAQTMTSKTGTVVGFDLHEYQGRLLLLGSDGGEGFPADLFEFTNLASERWRSVGGPRVNINPLSNAIEVAGVPQAEGGVQHLDACSGGGYTCTVYRATQSGLTYALIVDSATNQTVGYEELTNGAMAAFCELERVCFAGGKFFVQAVRLSGSANSIRIVSFEPGVSTAFAVFADPAAGSADFVTATELVPVTNNTTALLVSAFDRGAASNLSIIVYTAAGAQLGGTISVAGTSVQEMAIDANQADNTIALYTIETATDGRIRTFTFAGVLVAGPTATTSGVSGTMCRVRATVGADTIAVGVNDASSNFVIQLFDMDTHALGSTRTIFQFIQKTRLLSAPGVSDRFSFLVGGLLGATVFTNALMFFGTNVAHMVTRDLVIASITSPTTLTKDATTGQICWPSAHSPGVSSLGVPAITLYDFRKAQRIQGVNYGGLRYFAGATPWVYDGRVVTESCFNEVPVILSATPSAAGGSLTASARYFYQIHWEFTLSDGSYIESPVSQVFPVTMGAADNRVTLVVGTPHSLRTAVGPAYGMSATLVVSRTEWSPNTLDVATATLGASFSLELRASQTEIPADITSYGEPITVLDQVSDTFLSSQEPIYTQADRGPFSGSLEHNGPESCSYIAASASRLLNGGLARPYEVQISKASFIGQPFSYADFSSFFGQVSSRVLAVHSLDGAKLVFTSNDIMVLGDGAPDDQGAGALGEPDQIPTPSGLKDWRSLLEGPDGLWFQLDDDKLFRMPRGSGAPEWAGQDVFKLLKLFPTITATSRHRADNSGLFALNSAALNDARILVRDFLFETWLTDTPPLQASRGIEALAIFGRTVAYLSGGVAYVQSPTSFADNGATFIDLQLETQPIYPFELGGYGQIHDLMVTAQYFGDCILSVRVSYDDGVTYEALDTAFTISGLTAGATVQRKWTLPRNTTNSICVEINVNTAGSPSEGLVINQVDLLIDPEPGLPELLPAETA